MIILKIILFPFAVLYGIITSIRNLFYNLNIFNTINFKKVVVINVGNLSVGGTGKTPHVEYLVNLLKDRKKAILSRGYKRKTKGVILADDKAKPISIGDEPFQYYSKYKNEVAICVAEKRVLGAEKLINTTPELDTIILDDAFQHRAIDRDLNILITDYNNLFYNDYMMPSGTLREFRTGAQRASVVVVSKCPDEISKNKEERIKLNIRDYTNAPVFYSKIKYSQIDNAVKKCVLVTGIANSDSLLQHLKKINVEVVKHFDFDDHHKYSKEDIKMLFKEYKDNYIITTEKDYTKISQFDISNLNIIKIPIEVEFFGKDFDMFVLESIEKYSNVK